jgi:hypothetical protein
MSENQPNMDDDFGWEKGLDLLTRLLIQGDKFAHVRFVDGELIAATRQCSEKNRNCDGSNYTDILCREMDRVLREIVGYDPHNGSQILLGGSTIGHHYHKEYLQKLGYVFKDNFYRPDGWMACQVMVAGVASLRSLPMLAKLVQIANEDRLYLVSNTKMTGACGSKLIRVHPHNAVDDITGVVRYITEELPKDKNLVILYSAGMAGKIMLWDSFKKRQDMTHLDMGHFFDRAYGIDSRTWHHSGCSRGKMYDKFYTPLIKGFSK